MTELTYDIEVKLSVPEGVGLDSIRVRIEVAPSTTGCIIYGYDAAGSIQPVQIIGNADVDLPFVNPQVYVKYVGEPTTFKLSTLGWKDGRGAPRPSPVPPSQKH